MTAKDKVMIILTSGLVFLLFFIVAADFSTSFRAGRSPDPGVIELLKMSMTGIVGIIGGYLAGKSGLTNNNDNQTNEDNEQ